MPSLSLAYHFLFIFVFKISPLWVLISVTNVSQYKFPCRDDSVSCVVGKTELNWGLTEEQLNVAITTRIVVLFVIVRKKFENIYPNGNNSYLRRLLKRSWFSGVISLFQWASKFHKQIMPPRNPIWFDDAMLGETSFSFLYIVKLLFLAIHANEVICVLDQRSPLDKCELVQVRGLETSRKFACGPSF